MMPSGRDVEAARAEEACTDFIVGNPPPRTILHHADLLTTAVGRTVSLLSKGTRCAASSFLPQECPSKRRTARLAAATLSSQNEIV